MSVLVEPGSLKKTQEELGKYIKKPPLTEKLLNKPPFRFLHDIINAIITETGFLSGLYTDEELSSDNIKDKESKVIFLQKCIDATAFATGENITVRPSKIVAGHEADKTNLWLQTLGRAITQNVDSREAVEQVLGGAKPDKGKKAEKKPEKAREKTDKKPERTKKEAAGMNNNIGKNISPKDAKSARVRKPVLDNKAAQPKASQGSRPRPPTDPKDTRLTIEAKNMPMVKSPAKDTERKGTAMKTSRNKDSKEKPSRKPKSKEDVKSGSRSKSGRSRSNKDKTEEREGENAKTSKDGSPAKARSSKSRPASRMGQAKEVEKENSPPHEVISEDAMIPNGHATEEEMASAPRFGSSRPPSAKLGIRSMAEDGLALTNGPASLIQMEGEEGTDNTSINNNNNIDPAILKAAMGSNNDQVQDEEPPSPPHPPEPPDSGVGSLESPKQPVSQSQPQRTASTPAPAPLRALEQFDEAGERVERIPTATAPTPPLPPQSQATGIASRDPAGDKTTNRPRTGRRSARPPSARPAPPRVRERREVAKEEQQPQRPGTAKPVANVILAAGGGGGGGGGDSGGGGDEDDDDNFTVEETKPAITLEDDMLPLDPSGSGAVAAGAAAVGEDGEGAGLLVAQILETKKEMEDGRRNAFSPETPGHRRVPIEQSLLSDANRKKERELIQKDVQNLSTSIQSITRSVNPLAKMLDYLQEDLDSMQKELETWQIENKQLVQILKREQGATELSLEPLHSQLLDLETAVQEQRDKLSAVKSSILKNDEKIGRLMAGINLNI